MTNTDTARGGRMGYGVAGSLDHAIVRELAVAAEAAGYATFWVNDVPGGEGLAGLAAAAGVTNRIGLGVGVIPLDRQPPEQIARRLRELALPADRVIVGVGSGDPRGGLERVRQGVPELRALSGARVGVGALGPRMCQLAGETADVLLLNWLVPAHVPPSIALAEEGAAAAGRPAPEMSAYVRVALDDALPRLQTESDRYASYPAYAANFARMGVSALDTTVHGADRAAIQAGLAPYLPVLDETVARAIVADETAADYLRLLRAAAPVSS